MSGEQKNKTQIKQNVVRKMKEIKLEHVTKKYGNKVAVDDISLEIKKGEPFLICGGNGAGKSTILKMLLGLIEPTLGNVIRDKSIRIGYLPEERGVYQDLTVYKNLEFFAEVSEIKNKKESIDVWIERLELSDYRNIKARHLSKGNGQKLQLAITMISNPEFIILDEPFSGLDPINMQLFENLILQIMKEKYIVISSHQLGRMEHICSEVLFLKKSKRVLQGNIKEIQNQFDYRNLTIDYNKEIEEFIQQRGFDYEIRNNRIYTKIFYKEDQKDSSFMSEIFFMNKDNRYINYEAPSLEQLFIEKIQ